MPYIKKELRYLIEPFIDQVIAKLDEFRKPLDGTGPIIIENDKDMTGVLTYIVFRLIRHYYENGNWYSKMDAEKVCASAIDEFKRRFLHPYENKKIEENGDVR
jgi:hypothetical protein